MNSDTATRHFRFIEVLDAAELKRERGDWKLVSGWLEAAELLEPRTPKALLEGDWIVRMHDGTTFKEVTYKAEHRSVELSLNSWAKALGRRWAQFDGHVLTVSDGKSFLLSSISVKPA